MPSDNLENLFKQKVAEGQHTPPPFGWDQEASWQKLQPTLRPNRSSSVRKFYYGAAAGIILLMSVAITLLLMKNQSAENIFTTSQKVDKPVTASMPQIIQPTAKPETDLKSEINLANTQTISVFKNNPPENKKISERKILMPKIESEDSRANEMLTDLPKTELANNSGAEQVAAVPEAVANPIKITIVLGARSVAKIDSANRRTRAIAKNKLRLKMNLPGAEAANINQMATNSYYKPLVLEAKIKL